MRVPVASTSPQFDLATPRYRGLNPATYMVLALCYDSLAGPSARMDHDAPLPGTVTPDYATMVPRLAESFGENADGSWSLRLRAGVRSHAGNELTAPDIKWTFDQAFARRSVAAYRWGQIAGLAGPDSVEVVDQRTLRFKLRAPNPNLGPFLFGATPPILDSVAFGAHATEADPWAADWISAGQVAGYGPYAIEEMTRDQLRFTARADYWAGEPPVSSILVDRVDSRADAIRALNANEAVFVAGLRPDEVRALRGRDDLAMSASWAGHAYLGMSYHLAPFDDVRVRHALSYATPYDDVIEQGLLGIGRRWRGVAPAYDAWPASPARQFETDVETAKALLREAGYGTGLELALYLPMRPDLVRIAELLRTAYERVGIDLDLRDNLDVYPGWNPAFVLRTECGHNFNEVVYDIAHDYVPSLPVVPGGSGKVVVESWLSGYGSSRGFDEKYREILLAPTAAERRARTVAMQEAVAEFAPFVYLAENIHVNVANRHVSPWMQDHSSRPVQALQFQNCGTGYIG